MLSVLCAKLNALGELVQAASVRRELISFATSPFEKASAWRSLAEAERKAGRHDAAWEALRQCGHTIVNVRHWDRIGLGRFYIEELFRLAGEAEGQVAVAVFAEADRAAAIVPGLPLVAFDAAVVAAERADNPQRAEHYRAKRDAERKRIDALLERFR